MQSGNRIEPSIGPDQLHPDRPSWWTVRFMAMAKSQRDLSQLFDPRECFRLKYTGGIAWLYRPRHHFLSDSDWCGFNKKRAGMDAGCSRKDGYQIVTIRGKSYLVHRIVWYLANGPIPEGLVIDHIDGDPSNNRIENLRLATRSQNQMNCKKHSDGAQRSKGYYWSKSNKKFVASIQVGGEYEYLGQHDLEEDARAAYQEASKRLHGDFGRID